MQRLFCLLIILVLSVPAVAAQDRPLQETLQKENERADENEQKVRDLTKKAGQISSRLTDIERDVKKLKQKISKQQKTLNKIKEQETQTRKQYVALEKERQRITLELTGLMEILWPVHLQNIRSRFEGVDSWDTFDRRFNWLAAIYNETDEKLAEARENSQKIAKNFEEQQQLAAKAETQLASVNKSKDRLLANKYSLRRNLRKVKKQRQNAEEELTEILSTIEDLKYQLQSQKTKRFALYKRGLPWPVKGTVVKGYKPRAKPPIRGLVIRSNEKEQVQSVFWGKVVHNDTLRGFGHVVIVYHGNDYYSLYAYMSETYVRTGQEVEKNEPLGVVGYNPKADGPGLYFELRFHQKAINPIHWLIALK